MTLAVHELALAESVVRQITERLGDTRIVRVRLEVGRLAAVMPDALRFSFEVCTDGTRLQGAVLQIDETAGQELRIKEVEVG
jgi:hydrogenase nickel incorporation protein HypA/HybF